MGKEIKRKFTILDYPTKGTNTGTYSGASASIVANKVFNKLTKEMNFVDNLGGTKYLVFYLQDIKSKKIYPFIGTIVLLKGPVEVDYENKNLKINHRIIVAKYDNNMRETFKNNV